jgi:coproporphyrinogen III oxidase-like Fe-S oxidoreductase
VAALSPEPGTQEAAPWLVPRAAYLHVPFCRTKCLYCDFNTYAGKERLIGEYVAALADEVARIRAALGGGPFIFNLGHGIVPETPPEHVAELVRLVRA